MRIMLTLLLAACSTEPPAPTPLPTGLHRADIDSVLAEIESPQSRTRLYNFWATWCQPCMRELPELREFAEQHGEVDLVLVNVDSPGMQRSKVPATVKRLQLDAFRNLTLDARDPAMALNRLEGWPNSLPVTLVVSPKGERLHQFNVAVHREQLEKVLKGVP